MNQQLSVSAQRVQEALNQKGVRLEVLELPASTRTAQEAANTIGCQVAQIAKSLVFCGLNSSRCLLVVASGINRVDESKISQLIGEPIGKADANLVREQTGFAIGGIPPIGHAQPIPIFIDEDLSLYSEIWAAAGTPNSVFKLTPQILVDITEGRVCCIKQ